MNSPFHILSANLVGTGSEVQPTTTALVEALGGGRGISWLSGVDGVPSAWVAFSFPAG